MPRLLALSAAAAFAAFAVGEARATELDFTYTYADGQTFGVDTLGTLAADGNGFTVSSVLRVVGNGMALPGAPDQFTLDSGRRKLTLDGSDIVFTLTAATIGNLAMDMESDGGSAPSSHNFVLTSGASLPAKGYQGFVRSGYTARLALNFLSFSPLQSF